MEEVFELEGACLTVHLSKELDHPAADFLRRETERIMAQAYVRTMIFDFKETEFMDSAGIGLLMGRYRALGMRRGCIQAAGVSPHIERLLHLSGVHRYLEIHTAVEEGSIK